ncbi:MAG: MCE family protein [Chitinispirillaceae bacterium]|nr:MCE family protein [Chitinispirillaceae bacterium]
MRRMGGVHAASMPFVRRHRNFFAGAFLLIPMIVIPALLAYTLMKAEFLQGWCRLYVMSENGYGLTKGSPVTVSGMTVGHVQEVMLVREGVVGVRFKIKREYQPLIRRDTRARFQQKNIVVGDWTIELTGGTPGAAVVAENDTLQSIAPMRLDRTINQVATMVTLIETMLTGVLEGKGTVGRLLMEDTLVELVNGIGRNFDELVSATQGSLRGVDTLIRELTALGRSGSGFIDSLTFVAERVRTSLDDAGVVLKDLRGASGEVAPMLTGVRDDLGEAEKMMRTLQQSWIYRALSGPHDDPLLKGSP